MRAKHCSLYSGEVWYNRADTGSLAIFPGKWCQARDVAVTSTLDSLGTLQFGGQVTLARRSSCQGALPSLHPRHMVKAYWTATGVTRKRGQLVASKQSVLPTRFLRASSTGNVPWQAFLQLVNILTYTSRQVDLHTSLSPVLLALHRPWGHPQPTEHKHDKARGEHWCPRRVHSACPGEAGVLQDS